MKMNNNKNNNKMKNRINMNEFEDDLEKKIA